MIKLASDAVAPASLNQFAEASDYSLLLLGRPGSGKTMSLLLLVRALLGENDRTVRFLLSKWENDSSDFERWLINNMFDLYGMGEHAARAILGDERTILLLDGLDEAENVETCVASRICFRAISVFEDQRK